MPAHHAHPGRGPAPVDLTTVATTGTPPTASPTADRSVVDIVNHLFARFDVDGDTSITLSEWLGVVDPDGDDTDRTDSGLAALKTLDTSGDGALSATEVTATVSALDADADGLLSRSERQAAHGEDGRESGVEALLGGRGHGGHGGPGGRGGDVAFTPVTIAEAAAALFATYDSDGNSTIAVSELLAALDAGGRHADAGARITAAVAALDTDADGSLGQAEVGAALTARDGNADGMLAAFEVGHGEGHGGDIGLIGVLLHHADLPAA